MSVTSPLARPLRAAQARKPTPGQRPARPLRVTSSARALRAHAPRARWFAPLSILLLSGFSFGCARSSEHALEDTEGRRFQANCQGGACRLTQTSGTPAPSGLPSLVLSAPGRVVAICNAPAETDAPRETADCRALVCQADTDCPPAAGQPEGTCINGLCISTTGELRVDDAVWMCLAGTGLGRRQPKQVGLYAMAQNCGTPCIVPAVCRQP
ncbi:MAG: hypothetical protein KIT72_17975 [Polyangiaceae bacterium]|nr:hypothetical protein [Polyangiaceae bacterium]MCW5792304.1 hypothetical protein [Polyangiaceae bacterium]